MLQYFISTLVYSHFLSIFILLMLVFMLLFGLVFIQLLILILSFILQLTYFLFFALTFLFLLLPRLFRLEGFRLLLYFNVIILEGLLSVMQVTYSNCLNFVIISFILLQSISSYHSLNYVMLQLLLHFKLCFLIHFLFSFTRLLARCCFTKNFE